MAHQAQRDFILRVQKEHPDAFTDVSVLDIGSLNINGTLRDFFPGCEYLGVDVGEGRGVDLVMDGADLDFPDGTFDITVSAECFEHNPRWAETLDNMHRMSNRYVLFTCASTGRAEHGTTRSTPGASPFTLDWNYYRNLTAEDFEQKFDLEDMFAEHSFEYNPQSCDLYFFGIKR